MEQNKGPELDPHKRDQLIFDKDAKAINRLEQI